MKPYSQDLRDRIIQALAAGTETQRAIAERFCVSGSFVEKLWPRWRGSGSSAAKPHAGGRQCALKGYLELLRTEGAKQPEATLAAWRDRLMAAQGPRVSVAARLEARHGAGPDAPRSRSPSRRSM